MNVVELGIIAVFTIIPFLSSYIDKAIAQLLWYPCAIYILVTTLYGHLKEDAYTGKSVEALMEKCGILFSLILFSSIFVFNYYEIDYIWCWVIFAYVAIYIPYSFALLRDFDFSRNIRSDTEKQKVRNNIRKHIVQYWMFDLAFCAWFNGWNALTYILGTITVVIILWNATKAFLTGNELFRGLLPFEYLIGVGISAYLIYSIPDKSLSEIILAMAAAICGGLFTLIGVAWTIQKGETDRQADLRRIEEERREEDRKKHIPFLKIANGIQPVDTAHATSIRGIDFSNPEETTLLCNNTFYIVTIKGFNVKNISKETIILKGIVVHGEYRSFLRDTIVEAGGICSVEITQNHPVIFAETDTALTLVVEDILGNQYSVACGVSLFSGKSNPSICNNEQGEFVGFSYTYGVESVGLPILINNGKEMGS